MEELIEKFNRRFVARFGIFPNEKYTKEAMEKFLEEPFLIRR